MVRHIDIVTLGGQADRFEAEKTRIVSILEAGFAQRERLAVEKVRAEFEAAGRAEVERAVREQEEAVGMRLKVRLTRFVV